MTTPHQSPKPQFPLREVAGLGLLLFGSCLGVVACWLVDYRLGMGVLALVLAAFGVLLGYERSR